MEPVSALSRNNIRLVELSELFGRKLKKLDKNLTKTKDKLKSKEHENRVLCEKVAILEHQLSKTDLEKAKKEVYELKQLVSLLEFVVEETSVQNDTLQKKLNEDQNKRKRRNSACKAGSTNKSKTSEHGRHLPATRREMNEGEVCNQLKDDTVEATDDILNYDKAVSKPHCAVYLGLLMKEDKFPCKCGKYFGTKQDLKAHIFDENRTFIPCCDCGRTFASKTEMKAHVESFH